MNRDTQVVMSAVGLGAAGLLTAVGALMPWAEGPLGISVAGTEGDGVLTLLAGVGMGVIAFLHWQNPASRAFTGIGAGLGLAVVAIAVNVINNIEGVVDESDVAVRVGSGLYVTVLAGGVGIVAGAIGFAGAGKASQQIEPPEPPSELQFTEITSELRALTKLRDDGLITQDEYDEMRRRLADRL